MALVFTMFYRFDSPVFDAGLYKLASSDIWKMLDS